MIFPNGIIKEGYFEYNIFKGTKPTVDGAVSEDVSPMSLGRTMKSNMTNVY